MASMARDLDTQRTLRARLPEYANLYTVSDESRFIVASIKEVQSTAVMGGLMALIILYFFLRELKSTTIIGVAIPISIVATFIPMFIQEISLNIMSLGGLALGVGMLVDNSIVVLESIFRCKEEGDDTKDTQDHTFELLPQGRSSRAVSLKDSFQGLKQLLRTNRLGHVVIHTCFEATFTISFHCMGCHGDDGDMLARLFFLNADHGCRFQSVHFGHFHIHQDNIELL